MEVLVCDLNRKKEYHELMRGRLKFEYSIKDSIKILVCDLQMNRKGEATCANE